MSQVVLKTLFFEIEGARDRALANFKAAVNALEQSGAFFEAATTAAHAAHNGSGNDFRDEKLSLWSRFQGTEGMVERYQRELDQRCWMRVIESAGLGEMMDQTARRDLVRSLKTNPPAFTEEAVYSALHQLRNDAKLIFARGLATTFIELDRRFRSHDAFQFEDRVIITNFLTSWGGVNDHSSGVLTDLQRIFRVLDNNSDTSEDVAGAIRATQRGHCDPHPAYVETMYFRIRTFKNGNAHFWFRRKDLVAKANQVLADYYGAVLPDGVAEDVIVTTTALAKDLSYYPTPAPVVSALYRNLYIRQGDRILEPSAGTGALVHHALDRGATVDAYEVHPDRVRDLQNINHSNLRVFASNFLRVQPEPVYDGIVMNPPFYGTHWIDHVVHALKFLKPGGLLVSVVPATWEFGNTAKHQQFRGLMGNQYSFSSFDLPSESFASSGTRVNTSIIEMRRRF